MYLQPKNLNEALSMLQESNPKVIAGGTDVYPSLSAGHQIAKFLDVTRIHGFNEISSQDRVVRIGPAVTWSDILQADLPPAFDALKQAACEVGSVQIQNVGTIVGNVCNASPAADGVPPLLALDVQIELASRECGTRILPLSQFIKGVRNTDRKPDELISAIIVNSAPSGMRSAFEKLGSRRYLVISIAMTAVNVLLDDDGLIANVRIAVGSCSAVALRLHRLEKVLQGKDPRDISILKSHVASLSPLDDVRGTAVYRLAAAQEQIYRCLRRACDV